MVGETDKFPDVALVPDQPPEAVQLVTLLDDQERVVDCPDVIDDGDAEIETVGVEGGGGGGGGAPPERGIAIWLNFAGSVCDLTAMYRTVWPAVGIAVEA